MIGQVDGKFIAIVLERESEGNKVNVVVLVDQHAADERVQLERITDMVRIVIVGRSVWNDCSVWSDGSVWSDCSVWNDCSVYGNMYSVRCMEMVMYSVL